MKDFQAQVFCLTGVIPGIARADVFDHIAARDGEFVDRMNKSVTILIVGERGQGTTKYEKALQYGTEIMQYEQFMAWMFRTPIVDKDAHLVNLQRGSSRKYLGGAHVVNPVTGEKNPLPWEQTPSDSPCTWRGVGEAPASSEAPTKKESSFDWAQFWSTVAAIIVVICKGAVVLAGISICVVFWLIGIPVAPPKV